VDEYGVRRDALLVARPGYAQDQMVEVAIPIAMVTSGGDV
jgi:hypothetical protein